MPFYFALVGGTGNKVATKGSGQLKVAAVDSEKCKALKDAFNIKALPTVLVMKRGQLVDSFVGIPSQEELQHFFLRAVGATALPDGVWPTPVC